MRHILDDRYPYMLPLVRLVYGLPQLPRRLHTLRYADGSVRSWTMTDVQCNNMQEDEHARCETHAKIIQQHLIDKIYKVRPVCSTTSKEKHLTHYRENLSGVGIACNDVDRAE